MATIDIRLDVDAAAILTRAQAAEIAEKIVERAGLNSPDLGYGHGNTTGIRVPLVVSTQVYGQFKGKGSVAAMLVDGAAQLIALAHTLGDAGFRDSALVLLTEAERMNTRAGIAARLEKPS